MSSVSQPEEVAHRNFCDRVEVLNEIIHNPDAPLDKEQLRVLLEDYYPSFVGLCEDLRAKPESKVVRAIITDEWIYFHVTDVNGGYNEYRYDRKATDLE